MEGRKTGRMKRQKDVLPSYWHGYSMLQIGSPAFIKEGLLRPLPTLLTSPYVCRLENEVGLKSLQGVGRGPCSKAATRRGRGR